MDDFLKTDLIEKLLESDLLEKLEYNIFEEFSGNGLSDGNHKNNSNTIIINTNTPEIGTKIEYLEEINNILTNQKNKKDYYNNEYKEVIFYPFFNMEKGNKKSKTKYHLEYNFTSDGYYF